MRWGRRLASTKNENSQATTLVGKQGEPGGKLFPLPCQIMHPAAIRAEIDEQSHCLRPKAVPGSATPASRSGRDRLEKLVAFGGVLLLGLHQTTQPILEIGIFLRAAAQ